jgi:hypothetical protein
MTLEEHHVVSQVLAILRKHKLYLKHENRDFEKSEAELFTWE